ncbi:MAG: hypothetical protein AB7N80_10320 [Bdellovibrionales bacterium]
MKFIFSSEDWTATEREAAHRGLQGLHRREEAGFLAAACDDHAWLMVQERAAQIRRQADQFVVVGVGGSSLGAKALISLSGGQMPLFLDNLDPETTRAALQTLKNHKRTHWLWISKSGSTLETLAHLQNILSWCVQNGIDLAKCSTVVAEQKEGALQQWAKNARVPMLHIPSNVSGRFSVFTAAGLLPAALAGVDLGKVKQGIESVGMAYETLERLMAATLSSWRREEWVTLFWVYGDRLQPLTAWLQQLWAESLAKRVGRQGQTPARVSFPVACVGSQDQHSILQQVIEGARDKWVWLLRVQELEMQAPYLEGDLLPALVPLRGKTFGQIFNAQAQGTQQGMKAAGVATLEWIWPKADAEHAGFSLYLLEQMVAGLGECLDLNAFDQPGVERGKTITQNLLRK